MPKRSCGPPSGARARVSSSASTTCSSALRPAPPYRTGHESASRPSSRSTSRQRQANAATASRSSAPKPRQSAGRCRAIVGAHLGAERFGLGCVTRTERADRQRSSASASRRTGTSASARERVVQVRTALDAGQRSEHRPAEIGDALSLEARCGVGGRQALGERQHAWVGRQRGKRGVGALAVAIAVTIHAVDRGRDGVLVHDDLEVVGGLATVPEHRIDGHRLAEHDVDAAGAAASTTVAGRRAGARRADHRDAPDRGLPPSTRSGAARTPGATSRCRRCAIPSRCSPSARRQEGAA